MADKLYTMAECVREIYGDQSKTELREDYRRIDQFFGRMNMKDEWMQLKKELGGDEKKKRIWNKKSLELFKFILKNWDGLLSRRWGIFGRDAYDESPVLFDLPPKVLGIFEQSKNDCLKENAKKKVEAFLSRQVDETLRLLGDINTELENLLKEVVVTDESYLRAVERYYWGSGMKADIQRLIKKWREINENMDDYRRGEVYDVVTYGNNEDRRICLELIIQDKIRKQILLDEELQKYQKEKLELQNKLDDGLGSLSGRQRLDIRKEIETINEKMNEKGREIQLKCREEVEMRNISEQLSHPSKLVRDMDYQYECERIEELLGNREVRDIILKRITILNQLENEKDIADIEPLNI